MSGKKSVRIKRLLGFGGMRKEKGMNITVRVPKHETRLVGRQLGVENDLRCL